MNRLDDTDPVGAGEDDGSMLLPCEFCNELFPLDILVQHQVKPGFFINFTKKEFCNELFPLDILVQHQVSPVFFINFAIKEFCYELFPLDILV